MTTPTSPQALARALLLAAEKATPVEPRDLMSYEHGGGRLAIIRDGKRDLIADFYGDGADRDFYALANPSNLTTLVTWALEMEARNAELEKALKPFAEMAYLYDPDEGDGGDEAWDRGPTIGQLRAARSAIAGKQS